MLVTYSHLLKALLLPPPNPQLEDPPEWRKYVEWLTVMSQNIMSAANDLRPVQARYNLEAMMTRQLKLRRSETTTIHQYASDCFIYSSLPTNTWQKMRSVARETRTAKTVSSKGEKGEYCCYPSHLKLTSYEKVGFGDNAFAG